MEYIVDQLELKPYVDLFSCNIKETDLRNVDLTGANLRGCLFVKCDLSGAIFRNAEMDRSNFFDCNLTGADFTNADVGYISWTGSILTNIKGLSFVPRVDKLDDKILNIIESQAGELEMHDWHTCETTHCRAGWAIVLAGEEGRHLEKRFGSETAGALIYAASYPDLPVPDFFDDHESAMDDMQKRRDK